MSHVYPDPIQGPNSPLANAFSYQPMQPYPAAVVPQISLRDYFAAAALQGLLSIMAKDYDAFFANKLAHACYETADAMLKAKEAKP